MAGRGSARSQFRAIGRGNTGGKVKLGRAGSLKLKSTPNPGIGITNPHRLGPIGAGGIDTSSAMAAWSARLGAFGGGGNPIAQFYPGVTSTFSNIGSIGFRRNGISNYRRYPNVR